MSSYDIEWVAECCSYTITCTLTGVPGDVAPEATRELSKELAGDRVSAFAERCFTCDKPFQYRIARAGTRLLDEESTEDEEFDDQRTTPD